MAAALTFLMALLLGVTLAREAAAAERPPKRELPDYDGRGGPPTTPGDGLLWVPRVVLFPLYLTSEFIIRRPLGWLISTAEKNQIPALLYDFFAFGPNHKAGIFPTAYVDFGFEPSIGLFMFWNDAGFAGHNLRLSVATWGGGWLSLGASEHFALSKQHALTLKVTASRRPDYAYYGLGPESEASNLARYGADAIDARATSDLKFGGASGIRVALGYRGMSFFPGDYRGQPTLEDQAAAGLYPLPDRYQEGYKIFFSRTRLAIDSRSSLARSRTGVRAELDSEQGTEVGGASPSGYIRVAGGLGTALDLRDSGRVVSLSVVSGFAEPLGSGVVPFTELPTLGGPGFMPGFRAGRLRGESAIVSTLRYSWPVWMWLNGSMQAAVGNVFGPKLDGFALERLRFAAALGLESSMSDDAALEAVLGFGTETFENGAGVESWRFSIGVRSGL